MRIVLMAIKYVGLAICLLQLAISWRDISDRGVGLNTVWLLGVMAVLIAIPTRRKEAAEPEASATDPHSVAPNRSAPVAFLRRPFGWSWARWLVVIGVCALVIGLFSGSAKSRHDQSFLYGVILFQGIVLATVVRAIEAMFHASSTAGVFGRLAIILALGVVMFGLTVCSQIAQHGFG